MVEDYPDYTILVGNRISSIRTPINKMPLQVWKIACDINKLAAVVEDYPDYTILLGNRISSIRTRDNKIPL